MLEFLNNTDLVDNKTKEQPFKKLVASISGPAEKSTLDLKDNTLTIKSSEMILKVEAIPYTESPVDGSKV